LLAARRREATAERVRDSGARKKRRGDYSPRRSLNQFSAIAAIRRIAGLYLNLERYLFFLNRLTKLRQRPGFDLPDAFLGHAELLADFLQSLRLL
jgi:hypothetical protein